MPDLNLIVVVYYYYYIFFLHKLKCSSSLKKVRKTSLVVVHQKAWSSFGRNSSFISFLHYNVVNSAIGTCCAKRTGKRQNNNNRKETGDSLGTKPRGHSRKHPYPSPHPFPFWPTLQVSWCFKPSQPQRIASGLRETFTNRCIIERTNSKAEISPEEQSEKAESLQGERME